MRRVPIEPDKLGPLIMEATFSLDVVLELTKELDLLDALNLALTCSLCAELLRSPYFWISTLTRMDRINRIPLPCVPGTDLSALPLETLREIAIHAYKLHHRWSSPAPLPVSFRRFEINDEDISDFHPIEGARMVVTVSLNCVACWSADSGECLGFCDRHLDPTTEPCRDSVSSPFVSSGMSYIRLATCSGTQVKFTIVRVDHRNPSAVNVSNLFSMAWIRPAGRSISCVMVNAQTIGAFMNEDDAEDDGSSASTLVSAALAMECYALDSRALSGGLAVDDGFLIIGHSFSSSSPILSLNTTPSGDLWAHRLVQPMAGLPTEQEASSIGFPHVRRPTYGVLNVTARSTRVPPVTVAPSRLQFWPAEYKNSNLELGPIVSFEHPVHTINSSITVGHSRYHPGPSEPQPSPRGNLAFGDLYYALAPTQNGGLA
ncbi:hypothetical protein FB45DRAFT_1122044 [Roridomyces roridus]|uniref:F-box domain-containing protein n=1 Tax=Roridomyces roridus TaxID=1738132 RepID=A0AAD7B4Y5_9AGAR|nr:hypothetical protein FB45DRAFT_1122044 [Roridomyces roridus]